MTNGLVGPAKQQGVSAFGVLLLIVVTASVLTLGLKVGPLYMDNSVLTGLSDELVDDGTANDLTGDQIRQRFGNALRLNSIYDFDLNNDIQISRNSGRTAIRIAYERRVTMFANLDVIAAFEHLSQ